MVKHGNVGVGMPAAGIPGCQKKTKKTQSLKTAPNNRGIV